MESPFRISYTVTVFFKTAYAIHLQIPADTPGTNKMWLLDTPGNSTATGSCGKGCCESSMSALIFHADLLRIAVRKNC